MKWTFIRKRIQSDKNLKTQRSFTKRQTRGTSSDNEWQQMTTSGTTSDNEWQRVISNDNEWYNEWQRVTQQVAMSDTEWQKMVQRVKTAKLLQRMDDCNSFYNENRYTTSRDGWLILEWLNRLTITSSKKVAGLNKYTLFFYKKRVYKKV